MFRTDDSLVIFHLHFLDVSVFEHHGRLYDASYGRGAFGEIVKDTVHFGRIGYVTSSDRHLDATFHQIFHDGFGLGFCSSAAIYENEALRPVLCHPQSYLLPDAAESSNQYVGSMVME